jgi:hypothetical protein
MNGGEHIEIEAVGQLGMQPADHVELGRTGGAGRRRTGQHVIEAQGVAVVIPLFPAEGAEGTAVDAQVGVVDVAIDIEIHPVAVFAPVGQRRQLPHRQQVIILEQRQRLFITDTSTAFDDVANFVVQVFCHLDS